MRFIKVGERFVNVEQIVSITSDETNYIIRMANADCYYLKVDKASKKLIDEVLNADIQLSSKRTTERTDRNIQRPAK